ncbi:hypothetical protein GYMLUDRAFT_165247 [Collybiopsis luxurians FD-317 M1]|uniref:Uncharacterized protein n=1 Tax=Collybiopsis luxurians FD-317 M1 TaxID=944289 RepID=A0A0D0CSD3_9AGAR|nr:hypothetical protein GYMLUDRAFT_165247 [Collybiopsis luxurians FD-317 M1]
MSLSSKIGVPDVLLASLSPVELDSFAAVSRLCRHQVESFRRRAFKIRYVLEPFMELNQISAFQCIQRDTGTLVSGSVAYKFFSRKIFDSDLDLFCPITKCPQLARWLLSIGYAFTSKNALMGESFEDSFARTRDFTSQTTAIVPIDKIHESREIEAVWSFVNCQTLKWVQIIGTRGSPVAAILSFHSTAVMNFITYETAYSLYPRLTYEDKSNLCVDRGCLGSDRVKLAIQKWARRGYPVLPRLPREHLLAANSDLSVSNNRHVGDIHCWALNINLATSGIPPAPSSMHINSWTLHYNGDHTHLSYKLLVLSGFSNELQAVVSEAEAATLSCAFHSTGDTYVFLILFFLH